MISNLNYEEELRKLLKQDNYKYENEVEAYILEYFGSYVEALQKMHLYVLEEKEIKSSFDFSDFSDDSTKYIMEMEYRLRLKTEEELLRDRTAEIIRRRAPIGKCIVCNDDIYFVDRDIAEKTIHGWYHHDCMDGRLDPRSV